MHRCQGNLAPQQIQPPVGDFPALLGFHWLNCAGGVLEKDAGPVRTLFEGQAKAILAQACVLLNKIRLRQLT